MELEHWFKCDGPSRNLERTMPVPVSDDILVDTFCSRAVLVVIRPGILQSISLGVLGLATAGVTSCQIRSTRSILYIK